MFVASQKKPSSLLVDLYDYLESHDIDEIDGDTSAVTVTLENVGVYLINDYPTTGQIWLSSPMTGAHHFHYVDGEWVSTRDNRPLHDFINGELMDHAQNMNQV